jgi:hypothetical protein
MSIKASTAKISASPSKGRPKAVSVPERTTIEVLGTAATPLLVSIRVNIIVGVTVRITVTVSG